VLSRRRPADPGEPRDFWSPPLQAVLPIVYIVLDLLIWVLIAQAVLSWLLVFNVVNARNQVVRAIWQFTNAVTEPLLKPIRRVVKPFNGLDLSPLILMLLIFLIENVLRLYVQPYVP
jgi:YggT family protein